MQNKLMYAIIGDICGSRFERPLAKKQLNISSKNVENLINKDCKFTDDTVHTIALAAAIIENKSNPDFAKHIRIWSKKYPNAGYGGRIRRWIYGDGPNDSFGNGAYMRISPIYWAYDTYWQKAMMSKSIACTHDHPCSYLFIDYVINHKDIGITQSQKDLISGKITIEDYHNYYHFDSSCQGSVPESIYVANHSNSYVECIKNAILLGGDTDTQAAIAGGIYGYKTKEEIPEDLYNWAWNLLPKEMHEVLNKFEELL